MFEVARWVPCAKQRAFILRSHFGLMKYVAHKGQSQFMKTIDGLSASISLEVKTCVRSIRDFVATYPMALGSEEKLC